VAELPRSVSFSEVRTLILRLPDSRAQKPARHRMRGIPWIFVTRPSCTVIKTPHASGQSCGQAAWTTFFGSVQLTG
jgi:hypothetical protein